jgi:hypothetical protein
MSKSPAPAAGGRLTVAAACLLFLACNGQSPSGGGTGGSSGGGSGGAGAGGATGSGGTTGAGGATGAGGSAAGGAGGSAAGGAGGSTGTGGAGGAAGAGGSTGAGGTAGTAGGPVVPTQMSGSSTYSLAFGDVVFEVDAMTGGRVSKLSLAGTDLIVTGTSTTDPTTWGAVFWTSPRSAWTPQTWPPPAAVDNSPYTAQISGTHLALTGTTDPSMGVSMKKDYSADATSGWITINYTIDTTKAMQAAPWEVARVPRGGLVFFPKGSSVTPGPLTITQSNGIVWFDDSSKTATGTNGAKLTADGANGWEAYALGGALFLKKFTDTPANAQAPSPEGEICIYAGATWLEFEVQGPYTNIAANGNLPWKVQWRVVKIPSTVTVAAGSPTLLTFAQQQAAM